MAGVLRTGRFHSTRQSVLRAVQGWSIKIAGRRVAEGAVGSSNLRILPPPQPGGRW
jgi:hypothetical protein